MVYEPKEFQECRSIFNFYRCTAW